MEGDFNLTLVNWNVAQGFDTASLVSMISIRYATQSGAAFGYSTQASTQRILSWFLAVDHEFANLESRRLRGTKQSGYNGIVF